MIRGAVVGSSIGSCGSEKERQSVYMLRISEVLKGPAMSGDVKVCGATAPFLLLNEYIVAGQLEGEEIHFEPDSAILVFSLDRYFRLISYDSPIVESDRGGAYAAAIDEPNFLQRFSRSLQLDDPIDLNY